MINRLRSTHVHFGIVCVVGLTLGLGFFLESRRIDAEHRRLSEESKITPSQRTRSENQGRERQARHQGVKGLLERIDHPRIKGTILDQMAQEARTLAEIEEVVALAKKHLGSITPVIAGKWAQFDAEAALADTEMFVGQIEREARFLEILKTVAKTDFDQAMALLDKLADSTNRDSAHLELAQTLALDNPARAIQLVQKIKNRGGIDTGLAKLATLQASHHPERALATIDLIQSLGKKEDALGSLIRAVAGRNTDQALAIIRSHQDNFDLSNVYPAVIQNLVETDFKNATQLLEATMDQMRNHQLAGILQNTYQIDQAKGITLFEMALRTSSYPDGIIEEMAAPLFRNDFETGMKYVNQIQDIEAQTGVLDKLIYAHSEDLSFEIFQKIYDQLQETSYNHARVRLMEIAELKNNVDHDPIAVLERISSFGDQPTRDRLYLEIGESFIEKHPDMALESIQRIETGHHSQYRIARMIQAYLKGQ